MDYPITLKAKDGGHIERPAGADKISWAEGGGRGRRRRRLKPATIEREASQRSVVKTALRLRFSQPPTSVRIRTDSAGIDPFAFGPMFSR